MQHVLTLFFFKDADIGETEFLALTHALLKEICPDLSLGKRIKIVAKANEVSLKKFVLSKIYSNLSCNFFPQLAARKKKKTKSF